MRYFIELSYHGKAYHGWQVQKNANTVQEQINKALATYCREDVETIGSGRTDTGVHARQQFCHVDLKQHLDANAIHNLNSILPADIAIINIFTVASDKHARFDAISRSYQYHISSTKDPFGTEISYHFRKKLDLKEMNKACRHFLGTMDFQCFCKSRSSADHYVCTITDARWEAYNGNSVFFVSANRFLRGMVRALVGTLLEIGTKRMTIPQLKGILESGDRQQAGRSVPAHGLFLTSVDYPNNMLTRV